MSLTSVTCQRIERVIPSSITKQLNENGVLVNDQHRFGTVHSWEVRLIQTTKNNPWEAGHSIASPIAYFFRGYHHTRCIPNDPQCLAWIAEWFWKRTQVVGQLGEKSHPVEVKSGATKSQSWDHFYPYIYMYINNTGTRITSSIKLFANDFLLYRQVQSPAGAILLQKDLDPHTEWSYASVMWAMGKEHDNNQEAQRLVEYWKEVIKHRKNLWERPCVWAMDGWNQRLLNLENLLQL